LSFLLLLPLLPGRCLCLFSSTLSKIVILSEVAHGIL